jgi:ABC-2 type transport system permease protein
MLLKLVVADLKVLCRDRVSLFWALAFPVMFIGVFALFNMDRPPQVELAVVEEAPGPLGPPLRQALDRMELFRTKDEASEAEALRKLRNGDYDLVLVLASDQGTARAYYSLANVQLNQVALNALARFFDDFNLQAAGVQPMVQLQQEAVSGRDIGYMDFLVPGILGMGLMQYAIIGMATLLVGYRAKRILRRVQTTPLPVSAFVVAQVAAFLALSLLQTVLILGVGRLVGAEMPATFFWAFPLALLGNFVFLNVGIVVAALASSEPAAAGMGNAIGLPLMFLSGVFFPADQLPSFLRELVAYLPLAPLLEALRAVLLHGDPLLTAWREVLLVGAWAVATLALAVRAFRLE